MEKDVRAVSDMVERVARAIVRERYIEFTGRPDDFRELLKLPGNAEKFERVTIDFEWAKYVGCARAAIKLVAGWLDETESGERFGLASAALTAALGQEGDGR